MQHRVLREPHWPSGSDEVEAVFRQHPELGTRVGVQTSDHVVYLSGIVSDPSEVATAAGLAQQVKGVSRVENTIVVSQ